MKELINEEKGANKHSRVENLDMKRNFCSHPSSIRKSSPNEEKKYGERMETIESRRKKMKYLSISLKKKKRKMKHMA